MKRYRMQHDFQWWEIIPLTGISKCLGESMSEPGLEQFQQAKISWGLMNCSSNLYLWMVQNLFIYQRSFCPRKLNMV